MRYLCPHHQTLSKRITIAHLSSCVFFCSTVSLVWGSQLPFSFVCLFLFKWLHVVMPPITVSLPQHSILKWN